MTRFLGTSLTLAAVVLTACTAGSDDRQPAAPRVGRSDVSAPAEPRASAGQSAGTVHAPPYRLRVRSVLVVTAHAVYDNHGRHRVPFEVRASTPTTRGAVLVDPRGRVWDWQPAGLRPIGRMDPDVGGSLSTDDSRRYVGWTHLGPSYTQPSSVRVFDSQTRTLAYRGRLPRLSYIDVADRDTAYVSVASGAGWRVSRLDLKSGELMPIDLPRPLTLSAIRLWHGYLQTSRWLVDPARPRVRLAAPRELETSPDATSYLRINGTDLEVRDLDGRNRTPTLPRGLHTVYAAWWDSADTVGVVAARSAARPWAVLLACTRGARCEVVARRVRLPLRRETSFNQGD